MASNYDVYSPPECENNLQYKSIFNILKFLTISSDQNSKMVKNITNDDSKGLPGNIDNHHNGHDF